MTDNSLEETYKNSLLSEQNNNDGSSPGPLEGSQGKNQFELTPLEKLIDRVGGEHSYQFKSFMIFNLMWFLTAWMLLGQGFVFDETYECFKIDDQQQCEKYICSLPQSQRAAAMKSHANSLVFAFDNQFFICEDEYLRPILQSLLYVGSLLGFFVIPYFADNWGRRIAIRMSWGIFVVGVFLVSIADSRNMIGLGQLLTGFGCNPAITLCYSFLNQQVLRAKRQYYGLIIQVALALGQCTIAFVFMPDYSWRVVYFILLGLVAINMISLNYLVESPKYLISKSKKLALQALNSIAKLNSRPPLQLKDLQSIETAEEAQGGSSLIDLFKYSSLRWATIAGGLVFLAIQVIYYGTLLNLDHIGYSKLVNQQIIGISEGVGYLVMELIISKIHRKKWSLLGMGLSSILCFVLAVLVHFETDDNIDIMKIAQTIMLILNRFILCAFWGLFYVYIAELYPTKVRSLGFGWTSAMGTVGSSLAPYMIFYSEKAGINSWIPPGVVGLVGFFSIFCLNQTFKKPLLDEIEEVRLQGKIALPTEEDKNDRSTNQKTV